ncbi:hypothetical protein BS78_02G346800 [Paspalum vaginatum]|nr:hypothetical protein BS78_02G346800 [Paspalum vaginatum]
MAAANRVTPTIESTFWHPEHLLAKYHYSEASMFSCAACELIVTGSGYSCDECNFNIHEECFTGLPTSITIPQHRHQLSLCRLCPGASRSCDVCGVTSHAGRYVYHCAMCDYNVHPRCRSLVPQRRRRNGGTRQAIKVSLKVGMFGFRVVNIMTGGVMSPVLDFIDTAIDGM